MVEDSKEYLFNWEEIIENDRSRLIEYLRHNYDASWVRTADIKRSEDGTSIDISDGNNFLSLKLNNEKTKVDMKISEGRTDEFIAKQKNSKLNVYPNEKRNYGPGEELVGRTGIILFACYFIILSFLLLYGLIWFWPDPGSNIKSIFLTVALAGALGGQMHALRSFYWYVGNRKLVWSWLLMYTLLPFVGAILGLIFQIAILGGLFSLQAELKEANPTGFAAIAALVGLFSEQAARKLRQVAGTVFAEAEKGGNHVESR